MISSSLTSFFIFFSKPFVGVAFRYHNFAILVVILIASFLEGCLSVFTWYTVAREDMSLSSKPSKGSLSGVFPAKCKSLAKGHRRALGGSKSQLMVNNSCIPKRFKPSLIVSSSVERPLFDCL
ncbi:unnamed protein product [Dicrocoelium dendriticum]|nr:unnamed protein product [Dicrocoelium dendriticum]